MKTQKLLFINRDHLHAAVEQYLRSIRMIPEDEFVLEVTDNFGDVRVTTQKE